MKTLIKDVNGNLINLAEGTHTFRLVSDKKEMKVDIATTLASAKAMSETFLLYSEKSRQVWIYYGNRIVGYLSSIEPLTNHKVLQEWE